MIFGEFHPRVHRRRRQNGQNSLDRAPMPGLVIRWGAGPCFGEQRMTTEPPATPASAQTSRVSRIIKAPREAVYRACIDPAAVAVWRVPDNMSARVHVFDARVGGGYRMSLTYRDVVSRAGKSSDDTDTFEGRFV